MNNIESCMLINSISRTHGRGQATNTTLTFEGQQPCTVQKVETRKLVKAVDKEKEQEQYDLDLSSGETKNSKAHVFHTL